MCTLFSIKLPFFGESLNPIYCQWIVCINFSRKGGEALLESEVLFCSNKSGRNHPMNDKLKEVSLTEMLDAREARALPRSSF